MRRRLLRALAILGQAARSGLFLTATAGLQLNFGNGVRHEEANAESLSMRSCSSPSRFAAN